jgi:D-psicose/D-tagatose/L-ribulose 3-epimerase
LKLGLIENAWWGSPVGRIDGIRWAKELGFDTYDLYPIDLTPPIKRAMTDAIRDAGMPIPSFIVLSYSISDFNPEIRRYSIDWLKRQMDVGYDFASPTMVLALGEYILEKVELDPELQWRWAVQGVREVADYAHGLGMNIALEFLPHKFSMLNNVESMERFLRDVGHGSVLANVDVSHLFLMGDGPETISRLKGKVVNVHFSDCDGKVHGDLPPGRGVVPLKEYLAALERIGYEGPVSVELEWCPQPAKIRDWVNEAYTVTAGMMEELGIRK